MYFRPRLNGIPGDVNQNIACSNELLAILNIRVVYNFLASKLASQQYSLHFQWSSSYRASQGRLNHKSTYIAKTNNQGQWIQVDFGKIVQVTKIATQGRYTAHRQWITKYTVSYSQDCGLFEYQRDKGTTNHRVSQSMESFF